MGTCHAPPRQRLKSVFLGKGASPARWVGSGEPAGPPAGAQTTRSSTSAFFAFIGKPCLGASVPCTDALGPPRRHFRVIPRAGDSSHCSDICRQASPPFAPGTLGVSPPGLTAGLLRPAAWVTGRGDGLQGLPVLPGTAGAPKPQGDHPVFFSKYVRCAFLEEKNT